MRVEPEDEPSESGSTSHGSLLDISAEDAVQNGKQSLTVPAEAGFGVFDGVVPAVVQSEGPELSFEVFALVPGADAGVTEARRLFFDSGDAVVAGATGTLLNVGDPVEGGATWRAEDVGIPPFVTLV